MIFMWYTIFNKSIKEKQMTKFILLLIISQMGTNKGGITTTQIEFDSEVACKTTLEVMANDKFYTRGNLHYTTRIEKAYCIDNDTGEVVYSKLGYNGVGLVH